MWEQAQVEGGQSVSGEIGKRWIRGLLGLKRGGETADKGQRGRKTGLEVVGGVGEVDRVRGFLRGCEAPLVPLPPLSRKGGNVVWSCMQKWPGVVVQCSNASKADYPQLSPVKGRPRTYNG